MQIQMTISLRIFAHGTTAVHLRENLKFQFMSIFLDFYLLLRPCVGNVNTLRPRQNGRHFADDTLNRIFVNENVRSLIEFSLKFVPKGPINNISVLVQIMAWRRPGDKPLSEPMIVCLLMHICVTRPQWIKIDFQSGILFEPLHI